MLPKSIKVFGYDIKIKRAPNSENHGEFNLDKKTISLDDELEGDELKAALLHEVLHAVMQISGQSFWMTQDQEEGIVRALEHGLDPIIWFKGIKK